VTKEGEARCPTGVRMVVGGWERDASGNLCRQISGVEDRQGEAEAKFAAMLGAIAACRNVDEIIDLVAATDRRALLRAVQIHKLREPTLTERLHALERDLAAGGGLAKVTPAGRKRMVRVAQALAVAAEERREKKGA
jgi:hypothetical protein